MPISDMADALRKIKSHREGDIAEAASFLAPAASGGSGDAVSALLTLIRDKQRRELPSLTRAYGHIFDALAKNGAMDSRDLASIIETSGNFGMVSGAACVFARRDRGGFIQWAQHRHENDEVSPMSLGIAAAVDLLTTQIPLNVREITKEQEESLVRLRRDLASYPHPEDVRDFATGLKFSLAVPDSSLGLKQAEPQTAEYAAMEDVLRADSSPKGVKAFFDRDPYWATNTYAQEEVSSQRQPDRLKIAALALANAKADDDDGGLLFAVTERLSPQDLALLIGGLKEPQAQLVIDKVRYMNKAGFRKTQIPPDEWIDIEIAATQHNPSARVGAIANNLRTAPDRLEPLARQMIFTPGPAQESAVKQLLPMIVGTVDRAALSSLWTSANKQTKIALLQSVGMSLPAMSLVEIANGDDKDLAAAAEQILYSKKMTGLLSSSRGDHEV